ncbi:MAG: hypothetical protein ABIM54_03740 [candidate division WOR-3 bacterium]
MGKIKILFIITLIPLLWGCIIKEENIYTNYPVEIDTIPPSAPRGLYSVTGDQKVYLYFIPNTEKDLAGYYVWRGFSYEGPYEKIANLPPSKTSFIDYNVQNGITYYYAVSAYDTAGNESDLSPEVVFDTPRPDGEDVVWSYLIYPDFSGFDFLNQVVCSYLSPNCDFYYKYDTSDKVGYIIVPDTLTWIQDMGYAESFDEISYAPLYGWSKIGVLEAIEGHIYVFWTRYNHFAKIRILSLDNRLVFEWAYQIDEGNRELSLPSEGLKSLKIK